MHKLRMIEFICVILDNWELSYDCNVGFESNTFGIFDSKHIMNADSVKQTIKDECWILFIEYGYNEVDEELWGMMYKKRFIVHCHLVLKEVQKLVK